MPAPPEIPVIHFQSPVYNDTMLVEAHNTALGNYVELPIGSPHPNAKDWSGYILVKNQAFEADEKWQLRFYSADPEVENTVNIQRHAFDGEDILKEIYVRTYMVRRKDYAPATKKSTLSGIIYVRITAGGSGYDSTTAVTFSGGGGIGATGVPIVFRGTVVGVRITAEGTGYTNNPYVVFSGTGTGAAATAGGIRQNASAILVEERADRMDGEPEDGIYLKVTRLYHTLPGAEIVSYIAASGGKFKRVRRQKVALPAYPTATGYSLIGLKIEGISTVMGMKTTEDWVNSDGTTTGTPVPFITHRETIEPEGVEMITWVKTVDSSRLPPPVGATSIVTGDETIDLSNQGRRRIPTFPNSLGSAGEWEIDQAYVVHSERRAIEDSPNYTLIVQTCPRPRTRYEFPEITFQFPALWTWDSNTHGWVNIINGKVPLGTEGVTYIGHRTRQVMGCSIFKYSDNPYANLSTQFAIYSPGAGSVFINIFDANTIYGDPANTGNPIQIKNSGGTLIEFFDVSTVAGCSTTNNNLPAEGVLPTYYRVRVGQKPWKGNIYVREYLVLGEDIDIVGVANSEKFNKALDDSITGTDLYCA